MAAAKKSRKKVESTFAEKWEPKQEGDELSGFYLGSETAPGKRRGEVFTVYHIEDEKKKKHSVAGAHLDSIMSQIPRGAYVWITYVGTQTVRNGEMSLYDVDVDDGTELLDPYARKVDTDTGEVTPS